MFYLFLCIMIIWQLYSILEPKVMTVMDNIQQNADAVQKGV